MASTQSQQPPLPPDCDIGPGILAEYYILLALALTLVGFRIYIRLRVSRGWGWDDYTIIFALICLLVGAILCTIEVALGLGRHIEYLADPEQQALDILKFNTFFQMVNVLCTLSTKVSISLYILRIKDTLKIRWLLGVMMAMMTAATIAVIVVLSVSCIPLQALWDPTVKGDCLPLQTVYYVAYVQSAFTIITDLCLTVSPIVILWSVKIRKGRKTLICFLMSLGLVATVSNALRNAFEPELTEKDYTYAIIPITVVAILELTSGVIAACVPACMPAFHRKKKGTQDPTYGFSAGLTETSPSQLGSIASQTDEHRLQEDANDAHSLTALKARAASGYESYGRLV